MAELLDFTQPHVLRDATEYAAAVAEIDQPLDIDPPPHSEAYERLEFLSVLVQEYEDKHDPLTQLTTPHDVVSFMAEQRGITERELAQWLGGESVWLAFYQGTYRLSLVQIECLRKELGIPTPLLMSPGHAVESERGAYEPSLGR